MNKEIVQVHNSKMSIDITKVAIVMLRGSLLTSLMLFGRGFLGTLFILGGKVRICSLPLAEYLICLLVSWILVERGGDILCFFARICRFVPRSMWKICLSILPGIDEREEIVVFWQALLRLVTGLIAGENWFEVLAC